MAGFRNEGLSGRITEVDSINNLRVAPTSTIAQAGVIGLYAVNHDGVIGAARSIRATEVSVNRRLRVGIDNILFQDAFNYGAQNTAVWNMTTGQTVTWGSAGTVFLNSGSATGTTNTSISTYKFFPLYNGSGLSAEFDAIIPQASDSTTIIEWGLFQATGSAAILDGFLFRATGNTVYGVINYLGLETLMNLNFIPGLVEHEYEIKVEQELIEFWIDGALYGSITTPVQQAGPASSVYQPVAFRTIGTSTTVSSFKMGAIRVFFKDIAITKTWPQTMAGFGNMGYQGQAGSVMGSTAFMANNLAAGTGIALSQAGTTPAAYNGLGGQFDVTPTLAANTDGILCYYQVPAASATVPGKSLVITGVRIQSAVSTTLAMTASVLLVYSLAYGSTALTLATTESATTKAYRRIPMGMEAYAGTSAAQGTFPVSASPPPGMQYTPISPIIVNPGEYCTIAVKNVGTVTTTGVITVLVTFDSHWE